MPSLLSKALKNLEALARGYVFHQVNGKGFLLYSSANAACDAVPEDQNVNFRGLHIWKGWRGFFVRFTNLHPQGIITSGFMASGACRVTEESGHDPMWNARQ